jgi:uncharacterized protein (DUF1501 family)
MSRDVDCPAGRHVPPTRRDVLRLAAAGALAGLAGWPLGALAASPKAEDEYFIFIHASGGWDVTLWADPRNEKRGLIDPATTDNTDTGPLHRWVDAPHDEDVKSFALVQPKGSRIAFGPGIGDLADMFDRLCVINGIAMNTVSHPDGTAFSATGRHLSGSRSPGPSVDTILASELGAAQTFPLVSVQFPSNYVGENLDRRAVPLVVGQIGTISRSLTRSGQYDTPEDRDAVTALLSKEAAELAARSNATDVLQGVSLQYDGLRRMLGAKLEEVFAAGRLKQDHPQFDYKAKFAGNGAVNAAFALEALKRNVARCVSFSLGGFDTHAANYRFQAEVQQQFFEMLGVLVKSLDQAPHPTRAGAKLSDHTHLLVVSDFCRTPQINMAGGRDHYPNNSALIVSPRFKSNFVFGRSDPDQLLPGHAKKFLDGERPIAPPDILATFVAAFGVDPRRFMRDGEVVPELLQGASGAARGAVSKT